MGIFPEWLSRTIFGAIVDKIDCRITNKYIKIIIYIIIFILSAIVALGFAIAFLLLIGWIFVRLNR